METRERVRTSFRAIALLVVSITITAVILVAMLIDTLAITSLSTSNPLHCTDEVHPELQTLEFIEDC
jgi:hypothetical protein